MRKAICLWLVFALLGMLSCGKLIDTPKASKGNANFTRYIAIGGSETAGFADGALYRSAQQNSYPAMLAQQFALVGSANFTQPIFNNDNGLGLYNGVLVPKLILGYFHYSCTADSMFIPIRKIVGADNTGFYVAASQPFNNIGVPGLRADQVLDANLSQHNIFAWRMNGDSALNMVNIIRRTPPSFFTIWLGMQDILDYAIAGGDNASIPSAVVFRTALDSVLHAATTDTTAGGVIANIPDITEFPFFNALAYNGLPLDTGLANVLNTSYASRGFHFHVGANQFIISDATDPHGSRQMNANEKVVLAIPLDSIRCQFLGSLVPMPTKYVLSADEIVRIKQAVADYNQVIATAAAAYHIKVVDLNALYHSLAAGGIQYSGVLFTNALITGYFFSLDGLNPSYRGNALVANEFIKTINSAYRAHIPTLDPTTYSGPLIP